MVREPDVPVIDPVLTARPPKLAMNTVLDAAARFGVRADSAHDLGSERDQTFMVSSAGEPVAVLKVSNAAEHPDTLDMEALAVAHVTRVDAGLAVARPLLVVGGDPARPADHRCLVAAGGSEHWTRAYDLLPGHGRHDPRLLDDRALGEWGATTARLSQALRGFIHPRAIRTMPWDVQHAARCRPMCASIADEAMRTMVARTLDRFDEHLAPRWPMLRAQVVHGDLTIDNALVDDHGAITGIVDFGDMSHTALVADLGPVLDSLCIGRTGSDLLRVARLVLDGYQRVTPLESAELALVGEIWATRLAVGLAIASWRGAIGLEDPAFAERFHESTASILEGLLAIGWASLAAELGGGAAPTGAGALVARRHAIFGPATEALSYDEPIEMARATGVWMFDTTGRRFLDAYNNVPCVGHGHPRVAEAIARQARTLTTNMRYLHAGAIELAERLVATCPAPLDTVFFVNSGSEANDLAWRLSTAFTGNTGGLCTAFAYHGISSAIAPLSPETVLSVAPSTESAAPHVERWIPTDAYRNLHTDSAEFVGALARLEARGVAPAMTILDGVLQSDGVLDLAPGYVRELHALSHAAGALWVADEVQGGHGRTGEAMWSFQRFGIEPDIVTLGKPMGNGHPVAAVITRRDIAERLSRDTVFFSTFAGNQVSMAAAHAVLDVLDDERVLPRVAAAGHALRTAVRRATAGHPNIGDVRGMGLANAIEVVDDPITKTPARLHAAALKNAMRHHGVLVGTTGPHGNVIKVRPPLAFTEAEVALFVDALSRSLSSLAAP